LDEKPAPFQVPFIVVGRNEHQIDMANHVPESRQRRIDVPWHELDTREGMEPLMGLLE
jgi:hypothetical protein